MGACSEAGTPTSSGEFVVTECQCLVLILQWKHSASQVHMDTSITTEARHCSRVHRSWQSLGV